MKSLKLLYWGLLTDAIIVYWVWLYCYIRLPYPPQM